VAREYHLRVGSPGMLPRAAFFLTCRRWVKVTIPMADATTTFGDGVVLLERRDGIATVVLNRPRQHNALSKATWAGLGDAARAADADPTVGVIMLRGAGQRAFSAGADIKEFETDRVTEEHAQSHQQTVRDAMAALEQATKPVIAMIHGYCIGGGFEVALSADIRIADDRAEIGIPSAKMGILLDLEYIRRLVATMGPANASQVLFSGQRFDAQRALQMGLVNEVVAADALEARAYELASTIRDAAPTSVRWAKRCIQAIVRDPTLQSYTDWEVERVSVSASPEFREGVQAFMEKRTPRFDGPGEPTA
jgi:enoyl-CoA hydratase/carnithine racemase